MKTQISHLINGQKDVVRDLNHTKYNNASPATSHIGYAGSSHTEREETANKVFESNPNTLTVNIKGIVVNLHQYSSVSGKTRYYSGTLTESEFMAILGLERKPFNKHEGGYSLEISSDMTVKLNKFSRRNENAMWKFRGSINIGEEFVIIL